MLKFINFRRCRQKDTPLEKRTGMFWSGETLIQRLPQLIEPFFAERVDCAAYTLAVGPEVYVSPNDQTADPNTVTVRKLHENEAFTIPPGQFAFLLTEEIVSVPGDALALISIRAKIKFRGLVNVSGFHVDPGYHGQLTFAVFNAGPVPIHLRRGQSIFLIWYANLDCNSSFKKNDRVKTGIDTELINSVAGELLSFAGLAKSIKDVDKSLGDRIHAIEKEQTYYRVVAGIVISVLVGLLVGLAVNWVKDHVSSKTSSSAPTTSMPVQPAPTTTKTSPTTPIR
jgi:dCTP deaminase